jgi:hypothetical protein
MKATHASNLSIAYKAVGRSARRLAQGMAISASSTLYMTQFPASCINFFVQCLSRPPHPADIICDIRMSKHDKVTPLLGAVLLKQRVSEIRERRFEESFEANLEALSECKVGAKESAADLVLDMKAVFKECEQHLDDAIRRCRANADSMDKPEALADADSLDPAGTSQAGETVNEARVAEDLPAKAVRLLVA